MYLISRKGGEGTDRWELTARTDRRPQPSEDPCSTVQLSRFHTDLERRSVTRGGGLVAACRNSHRDYRSPAAALFSLNYSGAAAAVFDISLGREPPIFFIFFFLWYVSSLFGIEAV
jgi:hypothetical protein